MEPEKRVNTSVEIDGRVDNYIRITLHTAVTRRPYATVDFI